MGWGWGGGEGGAHKWRAYNRIACVAGARNKWADVFGSLLAILCSLDILAGIFKNIVRTKKHEENHRRSFSQFTKPVR